MRSTFHGLQYIHPISSVPSECPRIAERHVGELPEVIEAQSPHREQQET